MNAILHSSFSHIGHLRLVISDTTKLQVYICAPRTVEHDRWLPRATLRTKLDKLIQEGLGRNIAARGRRFGSNTSDERRIGGLRITSVATNRPLAPALQPKNVEAQEVLEVDEENGDTIWFQWAGKLNGIPAE